MAIDLPALRRAIQSALSPDLLSREQRGMIGPGDHPTKGHCAVAAEAAYHLLGGRDSGWAPVVLPRKVLGHTTHWWLRDRETGEIFDPTSEQFPGGIPYSSGRGCGFQGRPGIPSRRARIVIDRINRSRGA